VVFEAIYSERVRWELDRIDAAEYELLQRCIVALERNPFPPPELRAPLTIPGGSAYPEALRCRDWRIGYHVEDDAFLFIDDIARWPPRPSGG
jgi:mRNA-degrading endonuclease RelE of RelBE toxin-antitoxin system